MKKASFPDQAAGSKFSFGCLGRLSSADAIFAVFFAPQAAYSLRSPFGPHGTTCVTSLRCVPTATKVAGRAGRPCHGGIQSLFFQSRL